MGLSPVHASSSGLSEVINLVSWQHSIILDSPLSGECDFRGEKGDVQVRGGGACGRETSSELARIPPRPGDGAVRSLGEDFMMPAEEIPIEKVLS
jgi:hypothetical protein